MRTWVEEERRLKSIKESSEVARGKGRRGKRKAGTGEGEIDREPRKVRSTFTTKEGDDG